MVTLFDRDYTRLDEHRYTLHEVVVGFGLEIWDTERPFPIFDESYRETLQNRIYDHFEYRRIAASTPQMFVNFLNRRMREQMPAYNEIYKRLAKEDFDPYLTSERHDAGNNRSTSESNSGSKTGTESEAKASSLSTNTTSNTPASYMEDPYDPKYMSSLAQAKSDSDSSSTGTTDTTSSSNGKSIGDYIIESTGRSGYLGDAVMSSLATGFLNTDLMVCDMLEPLFMQFWDDQPL